MSRKVAALVLAAGGSSRLGQPKQLVEYHGERLIDRAIRIAREAGASPIFVVLGAEYESILKVLTPFDSTIRILINKGWKRGMASSIALGASAAERVGADDLLILTCDQVSVTREHLKKLMESSRREHVVASYYWERRGIPALFPDFAFHALQELTGDTGARDLLQDDAVFTVPLPGGEFDVDTPGDLERLRAMEHDAGHKRDTTSPEPEGNPSATAGTSGF
ncbi:nucleotidyltransferase family protein [Terriglobus roseus]|uniref:Molybdenum cofactor cytidylyltransferase/nicotine blue oxidoreductase n=1 Tax=Terriglobus roseus TaxID=392734 RepID=A0A1H4M9M2_9BACT|nr:nucleotidyltransferase family protein [Terriglobus roseus]SEB79517.1 molybdenum cofactor cytidylyltransferase/nicotine blue oxidoreductase [Terriglobus roseus]